VNVITIQLPATHPMAHSHLPALIGTQMWGITIIRDNVPTQTFGTIVAAFGLPADVGGVLLTLEIAA
jgi:hypothetical protein